MYTNIKKNTANVLDNIMGISNDKNKVIILQTNNN